MARRSPGRVRGELCGRPALGDGVEVPGGLSRRGLVELAGLERDRFWPGAAAEALDFLRLFVRDPMHRLWDERYGCGEWYCCPNPSDMHRILQAVAAHLPPRDARMFRARIAELYDRW
jgi:hypothetical protein